MSMMSSFMDFLQSECLAIQAFIESAIFCEEENNDIDIKIANFVSQNPRLQEYFAVENIISPETDVSNPNTLIPWS
jgi:hypothetical protein